MIPISCAYTAVERFVGCIYLGYKNNKNVKNIITDIRRCRCRSTSSGLSIIL